MGRSNIAISSDRENWKRLLPGVIISAVALLVVIYLLDVEQFKQALLQADLGFLLAGSGVALLWLVLRSFVWRTLLQYKASYRDVFLTINEGYLLNNILPFRLGEVARAFLIGRKANLDFWQVVPSILVERLLDLAIAAGLFLATLPFVIGVAWARQAALIIGIVVLAGLVGIYILARSRQRVLAWIERAGQRWPVVHRLAGRRVAAFLDGLAILTDGKIFLTALGWMALNWAATVLQYYLLLRAFFPQPSLLWALFVVGVGSLGIAAPSSPGALGVFEAAMVGALAAFDVDASSAAAYAITTHAVGYVITGLIGGYALYRDGESLSGLYARLRKQKFEEGGT